MPRPSLPQHPAPDADGAATHAPAPGAKTNAPNAPALPQAAAQQGMQGADAGDPTRLAFVDSNGAMAYLTVRARVRDARFRRCFAVALFCLFAAVVLSTIGLLVLASLAAAQGMDPAAGAALIAAVKDGVPIALSAVTGVFGTAVGFYFGAESDGS